MKWLADVVERASSAFPEADVMVIVAEVFASSSRRGAAIVGVFVNKDSVTVELLVTSTPFIGDVSVVVEMLVF